METDRSNSTQARDVTGRRLRLLTIVILVTMTLSIVAPFLGLASHYVILSESMVPTLYPGDVVFTTAVDGVIPEESVIVFQTSLGSTQTHRVTDVVVIEGTAYYQTQGDANAHADSFLVPEHQVVGVLSFVIPRLGLFYLIPRDIALILTVLLVITYALVTSWASRSSAQSVPPINQGSPVTPAHHRERPDVSPRTTRIDGRKQQRRATTLASLLIIVAVTSTLLVAYSSVHLIYLANTQTTSVTTPSILVQTGNAGSSTITDNINANVSVTEGTSDYVLRVNNTDSQAWQIRLTQYASANMNRLQNCTLFFHNTTDGTSRQIAIEDGVAAQALGPWYPHPAASTIYLAMVVSTNSTGSSNVQTYLELESLTGNISLVYTLRFTIE